MARRKRKTQGINSLGDLEVDIMGIVWNLQRATVKEVFEIMYERRKLAYTTIMTVMNRLAVKGILAQDKSTVPYVYTPLVERNTMAHSMVGEVVDRLLEGSSGAIISYLMDRGGMSDDEISALKAKIAEKEGK
jgi:predicted transcriptional regulator